MVLSLVRSKKSMTYIASHRYCSDPKNVPFGSCLGTDGDDEIFGTDKGEEIASDTGNDIVRAGRGPDEISNNTNDSPMGDDTNYGGPGNDRIEGAKGADRHYGGRGDDVIGDDFSGGASDFIRCGPGYDTVYYNGIDKVATDCEARYTSQ